MNRRVDLLVGLCTAVLLHLALVAGATWCIGEAPMVPEFTEGASSVRLTLVASPAPVPEPMPVAPPPPEALPELPPEPALLSFPEPVVEEPVEDAVPQDDPDVAPQPVSSELDADQLDKGVESSEPDTSSVRPRYPLGSRLRGEEGLVELRVQTDRDGRALDVIVTTSSGYPALDRAAVKAARAARYVGRDGSRRAGLTTFGIRFRLDD